MLTTVIIVPGWAWIISAKLWWHSSSSKNIKFNFLHISFFRLFFVTSFNAFHNFNLLVFSTFYSWLESYQICYVYTCQVQCRITTELILLKWSLLYINQDGTLFHRESLKTWNSLFSEILLNIFESNELVIVLHARKYFVGFFQHKSSPSAKLQLIWVSKVCLRKYMLIS